MALILKAAGLLDVDAGEIIRPGVVTIEGDRIVAVGGADSPPPDADVIDLGDAILLPGLMDMEVNLLMGGRGETPGLSQVQDDPPTRVLRAVGNARRTLRAGFTTVRNLGLFVKTGGYLLDVALSRAIDAGLIDGPRVIPAGHAITPTGGHLDPTMFAAFMPGVLELTIEEGIANGVDEIRKAVRYQIKHGAQLIKVCCSGGVMSLTGEAGAQHYSDEELRVIVDEAHRRGLRVAAHTHGAEAVKHAIDCGIDCIEHGFLMDDEAIKMLVDNDRFLVTHPAAGRVHGRLEGSARVAGQGRRDVPEGADVDQGRLRGGREDRRRHRRTGDSARQERRRTRHARRLGPAAGGGAAGCDRCGRRADQPAGLPGPHRQRLPRRHHRGAR